MLSGRLGFSLVPTFCVMICHADIRDGTVNYSLLCFVSPILHFSNHQPIPRVLCVDSCKRQVF